ncbi:hypothetical protein AVEN_219891-1 [Araneus ventricosus]|uniref:Uncharacterized protein n=1 Tax=Araneus ventricosus TaxID=182803 RepID=A0A4Y2VVY6_ARAVE|nr:hypothetical protein AVEN_84432-1 [Araneus ventricosus]GBO28841.1 hypothetical protein AVEN_219891-1 [Araneus ventricosus]
MNDLPHLHHGGFVKKQHFPALYTLFFYEFQAKASALPAKERESPAELLNDIRLLQHAGFGKKHHFATPYSELRCLQFVGRKKEIRETAE